MSLNSNNSNSDNGSDDGGDDDSPLEEFSGVRELITVPDRDLSEGEMAKIMRQVARVCNLVAALHMKHSALSDNSRAVGAGHPICQSILACAAQADTAAINLAGPPQVMQPHAVPAMIPRRH
jgi:hypothetical protein